MTDPILTTIAVFGGALIGAGVTAAIFSRKVDEGIELIVDWRDRAKQQQLNRVAEQAAYNDLLIEIARNPAAREHMLAVMSVGEFDRLTQEMVRRGVKLSV